MSIFYEQKQFTAVCKFRVVCTVPSAPEELLCLSPANC